MRMLSTGGIHALEASWLLPDCSDAVSPKSRVMDARKSSFVVLNLRCYECEIKSTEGRTYGLFVLPPGPKGPT